MLEVELDWEVSMRDVHVDSDDVGWQLLKDESE